MLKKLLVFSVFFIAIFDKVNAQSPKFGWAKSVGVSNNTLSITSMAVDKLCNTFYTGSFIGTVDFDPSKDIYNLTSANTGGSDIFIIKMDAFGNFIWAKRIGGSSYDVGFGINVDDSGNVYSTGKFTGTVDFDPGPKKYEITSSAYEDMYVSKWNSDGDFIWTKTGGLSGNDKGYSLKIDKKGNVFVTGTMEGAGDFDPDSLNTINFKSYGGVLDFFTAKLDVNGKYIWVKSVGGTGDDFGYSIDLDNIGNVYIAGKFDGKIDLDPSANIYNITSYGLNDVFVLKLDSNGNFVWADRIGGKGNDYVSEIKIDKSNNIYIVGDYEGICDFDPSSKVYNLTSNGLSDSYFSKYDSSGRLLWVNAIGGVSTDGASSIDFDDSCFLYITGGFAQKVDFDPSADSMFLIANGPPGSGWVDIYISKYDSTGKLIWANGIGGANHDIGKNIKLDIWNNIYSIGYFTDSADFDISSNSFYLKNTRSYYYYKLLQCEDSKSIITETACGQYVSPSGKYTWNTSGTYYDTIHNISGCDSFITFNLTIIPNSNTTIVEKSCDSNYISPSGKYIWNKAGFYSDTLVNSNGCDSIIYLSLTFGNNTKDSIIISECNSYISPSGKILTSSNIYYDTIPNQSGCDSIIKIDLTILQSTTSVINDSFCNQYISPSGKYSWTKAGTFYDTLQNNAGCDSFITIHLKLLKTYSTISETVCDSYTSPSGKILTVSNIYYDTLTNQNGCDSIIEINLTILQKTYSLNNITACKSYTSPSGKYTWTKTGVYADTITNQAGCDSVIGIDLIINNVDVSVVQSGYMLTAIATNSSYQWLDCNQNFGIISGETNKGFTAQNNGDYAVRINQNNCTDTSICYSVTSAGINKNTNFKYQIYPNPSKGMITIEVSENSDIKIYDGIGKLVYKADNIAKTSQHDLSNLSTGIYYIQLSNYKGIITENIIMEK